MSDEKEIKNDQEVKENEANETKDTIEENEEPTAEQRYAELNDKYIRIHAEFDNYRKRTNKEKVDIINTANAGMMKDLLSVIDDFQRAQANNENAEEIESVKEGFNLI